MRIMLMLLCCVALTAVAQEPEQPTGPPWTIVYETATGDIPASNWHAGSATFGGLKEQWSVGTSATATGKETNISQISDLVTVPTETRADLLAQAVAVMASDDNTASQKAQLKAINAKLAKLKTKDH